MACDICREPICRKSQDPECPIKEQGRLDGIMEFASLTDDEVKLIIQFADAGFSATRSLRFQHLSGVN